MPKATDISLIESQKNSWSQKNQVDKYNLETPINLKISSAHQKRTMQETVYDIILLQKLEDISTLSATSNTRRLPRFFKVFIA